MHQPFEMELESVIQWYYQNCTTDNKHTRLRKKCDYGYLLGFLSQKLGRPEGEIRIGDITRAHLQEFVTARVRAGDSGGTLNNRIWNIKHLLKNACAELGTRNPAAHLKSVAAERGSYRGVEDDSQRDRAIEAAYQIGTSHFINLRTGFLMELLFATPFRPVDIEKLKMKQVHPDLSFINGVWQKGRRNRRVYVPTTIRDNFRQYLHYREQALIETKSGYRTLTDAEKGELAIFVTLHRSRLDEPDSLTLRESGIKDTIRLVQARAGFKINSQMARHTYAHRLLKKKDIRFVCQAMGHSDVRTTMRYTERRDEEMAEGTEEALRA